MDNFSEYTFNYFINKNILNKNINNYPLLNILFVASENLLNLNYKDYLYVLKFYNYKDIKTTEIYLKQNIKHKQHPGDSFLFYLYNNYMKLCIFDNILLDNTLKKEYLNILLYNQKINIICKKICL